MNQIRSANQKEKVAKIRQKSKQENLLSPTFAAVRHVNSLNQLHTLQPNGHLLQRQCACGKHTIAGQECDDCRSGNSSFLQRLSDGSRSKRTTLTDLPSRNSSGHNAIQIDQAPTWAEPKVLPTHTVSTVHLDLKANNLQPNLIQRAVRENVIRDFQTNAQVCLIHLHGDEQNALHVAQDMRATRCANLVHLNSQNRCITVDVPGTNQTCTADPNRIFSNNSITIANAFGGQCTCSKALRPQAVRELEQFKNSELNPAIHTCRRGGVGLPMVVFHNNTPGALSINSYRPGHSEAGAAETSSSSLGGMANPSIRPTEDPDNFFLTTDPRDFAALRNRRNAVLQSSTPTDDGSLSVAMAGARYINVEAEGKPFRGRSDQTFITNAAMANEALNQLGISQNCADQEMDGSQAKQGQPEEDHQNADVGTILEQIIDWIGHFLQEVYRVLEQLATMPEPLPRETPPSSLPRNCQTFNSQADLDAGKAHWVGIISSMPPTDVIDWIIGVISPPAAVTREATQQRNCLLHAIQAASRRSHSSIHLPRGHLSHSDHRDFARQRGIWQSKFNFDPGRAPFDRISDHARDICGALLLPREEKWDPRNPRHRVCWNARPLSGTTPPPMPSGATALSEDERQAEILQASSAPGISRHHWGTDFDLFDPNMNPAEWERGGNFADEYSWLMRNASTYGFIQSFTAGSAFMSTGYMEERWHWSYYPVAQALLEFARTHQSDIQTALFSQWGTDPQFSFIRGNWQNYMFNVNERGWF